MSQPGPGSGEAGAEPAVGATLPESSEPQTAEAPEPGVAAAEPVPRAATTPWWLRRYTFTGTALGLVFLWLSMTPSLLPRGPLFQGLVSGASGAIGYALGVFAVWLVRFILSRDSSPRPPKLAWLVLVVV